MKRKNDYERVLEDCLVEMFRRVGVECKNLAEVKLWAREHGNRWFTVKKWTKEHEQAFRLWMDERLKGVLGMSKNNRSTEISLFLLMWGWSLSDE